MAAQTELFDLIESAWIPVVSLNGDVHEVGLREALVRAHEWREIRDPIPLVDFGLYRLLAALILDIHKIGKNEFNRWAVMVEKGCWEETLVDGYLAEHSDRFRLFDAKHPFLQTSCMDQEPAKPLAGLLPAIPSGTNAAHFHHYHEGEFGVSPAAAARLLTTIPAFMTAGGAGLAPSINGAPPWYVLAIGKNLFETVCLNAYVLDLPQAGGNSPPAWRNPTPIQDERRTNASLLEAMTWRPRRIQLIPGQAGICALTGQRSDVIVRSMRFRSGESVDFFWRDPNVPYKVTDDKGWAPMRPSEAKEIWRDSGPLGFLKQGEVRSVVESGNVTTTSKMRFDRPLVIEQVIRAVADGVLPKKTALRLTAYGMRTDMKMKVFEWIREPLSLPFEMLLNSKLQGEARQAMVIAEDASFALKLAIKKCYPSGGDNKNALQQVCDYAGRRYWSDLHEHYDSFLKAIATTEDTSSAIAHWKKAITATAWEALRVATDNLDGNASAIERLVKSRDYFAKRLYTIFTPPGDRIAASGKRKTAKDTVKETSH